jgi:hypothetical protein
MDYIYNMLSPTIENEGREMAATVRDFLVML